MKARIGAPLALAALSGLLMILPMGCGGGAAGPGKTDAGGSGTDGNSLCSHCGTQACCKGTCTDTSSDTANCGGCGNACAPGPSPDCANAQCTCIGNGRQACTASQTCCANGCMNINTDSANCGGCGKACVHGQACNNGTCSCGSVGACSGSQMCCSNTCVNTMTDNNNCGSCGHVCTSPQTCTGGNCSGGGNCNGTTCPSGWTCCPDFCCHNCSGSVCLDSMDGGS